MKRTRGGAFVAGLFFALFLCFLKAPAARAQSTTDGAIGGTVFDSSGAAVANARVSVRNNGTNAEQSVTTDETGYYRVTKLQPGSYTVSIEATGFAAFKAEQVIVQVGSVTELAAHLNVGSAAATIIVNAETPQVNTTSADFAPTVDQVAINNLPINGGRWSDFALLTPSVVNDANGFGLLSFRGISTLLNNNTVDGADNNQGFFSEERGRTRIGYSTAKAAVQEFQVNTSNYSAEYGRAAGAVVNTVTKSGTNQFHGEAYFYDRDNNWGATNPFTKITTQTSPGVFTSNVFKPEDVRKMWGGGIGGPIWKDKIFFHFAFDRYDRHFPGTAVPASPSAFFATPVSDLTNYSTADSCATLTPAAFTSGPNALVNGANIRTATQGACTLFSNLGLANYAAAVTDYNNGLNGLLGELGPVPRYGQATIFFPKIDWVINQKNRASFEVNRMRWISPAGIQTQATNTFGIASFGNDYVRDTWGIAKLYTFFTSSISNEMRYQYGRDFEFEFAQPPSAYESTNLVNPAGYTNPLGLPPDVFITNGFDMGVPTFLQRPAFPDERRQQFADSVNWTHGKHNLKFGVDFVHTHDLSENLRTQYGSFQYGSIGNYISDLNQPNRCGAAHNLVCYNSYAQAFGPLGFSFSTNDIALFVEDSWRILPRFTLDLGLRYEYEKLPSPFNNLINASVPQTSHLPSDKNNLGPRIGIAWDIFGNGKTSLRAGYGIYNGRIINSTIYSALTSTGAAASQLSFTIFPTITGGAPNPSAPPFPQIINPATPPPPSSGLGVVYFDSHFQAPQIHQTDLTLEREVGWNTVVSVSYLGSFGRSLPDFVDTNINPALASTVTYTVGTGGPLKTATYTTTLFKGPRPNPNLGATTDIFSGISSNYNAFTAQVNHRLSHHVQFGANYTWSHALDYGQNGTTFNDTNDLLNPFNIKGEYGNSIFNVPNRMVLNAIVESPWHVNGWKSYLINGWQLAPIYQIQNGLPYSLVTSGNAPGGLGGGVNGSNGRKGIDVIGRNSYRLPRTQVVDLRISKKFTFAEKYSFEALGEAFNLFNHLNVTGVNTTGYSIATSGSVATAGGTTACSAAAPCLNFNAPFGTATSANSNFAYSSRQIQIGFRFLF
jgi:Carboxypeptidase regulatory-like domain/TonB dependent receptor